MTGSIRNPVFRLVVAVAVAAMMSTAVLAKSDAPPPGGQSDDGHFFLEVDSVSVTIFRNNLPAGQMTTLLILQMDSSEAHRAVWLARVKIKDIILRELHRLLEREANGGKKVDLDLIKARVLKRVQRHFGPEIVSDVFVQALIRRGA